MPSRVKTSGTLPPAITIRLRHLTAKLHALGPRPTFELLCELYGGADLISRLERYAELDPDFVHALGGDTLPARRPFFLIANKK